MAPDTSTLGCIDTVIFVDVDGVLNVGIKDGLNSPMLLNETSMEFATTRRHNTSLAQMTQESVERLLSVMHRTPGKEEEGTYRNFACVEGCDVSELLIERLARLIRAAGAERSVVLSSNWRHSRHSKKVEDLESRISKHLGNDFQFDARTDWVRERCAADRMKCIGDHVRSLFMSGCVGSKPLKVLVLDDFSATPLSGWTCGRRQIHSAAHVEAYLRSCAPEQAHVSAKLIHTFDEWLTPGHLELQLGTGLSLAHCKEAEHFLVVAPPNLQMIPFVEQAMKAWWSFALAAKHLVDLAVHSDKWQLDKWHLHLISMAAPCWSHES